jgi:serine/threonine protein kinase
MKHCPICRNSYPSHYRTCPQDAIVLVEGGELEPGTIFHGIYRITRLLGRGGMGVVYLAEHILLRQPRALKLMTGELMGNPDAAARMIREAQRASEIGLEQANIVKTLDMGQEADGSFFLCMEYVDGPSLLALIEQNPQGMAPERAIALVRGVATGLAAAHAKGMVHRDIKPENILVARDQNGIEIPKITDFGIVTGREEETRLSRTGIQPLTPGYAAPELWEGIIPGHELDGRTDLYALGCVFFELLTGRPPFHGHSLEELRKQHLSVQPLAPSEVRPELANYPGLDKVVQRLLQKSRDQRPADVRALLAEFDQAAYQRTRTVLSPALRDTVIEARLPPVSEKRTTQPASVPPVQKTATPDSPAPARFAARGMKIGIVAIILVSVAVLGTQLFKHSQDHTTSPDPTETQQAISTPQSSTDASTPPQTQTQTPKTDAQSSTTPSQMYDFNFTPAVKKDSSTAGAQLWSDGATGHDWAWFTGRTDSNWSHADSFCRNLHFHDKSWRLPSVDELRGIYDSSQPSDCGGSYQCYIKGGLRLNGPIVWSSDLQKNGTEAAAFMFDDGSVYGYVPIQWTGYRAHIVCIH